MKARQHVTNLVESRALHLTIAILILVVAALWFINYFRIAYPVSVTTHQGSGDLAVVGEGKVDVVPDTASVNLGIVVSNAATVDAAESQINDVNNAIVSSMQGLGIADKDISTSNYSINPNYNYESGGNEITGYSGNANITIKVRDLDVLPQAISAATEAGANQVLGTNFIIDNPDNFREQARNEAIENAREQAKKLADSLGIRLGKVTNIVESGATDYPPMPYYDRALSMESAAGGSANLQPGTQTVTSTVTLYFEKR